MATRNQMTVPFQNAISITIPTRLTEMEIREFEDAGKRTVGAVFYGDGVQLHVGPSAMGRKVANRIREARSKHVKKVRLVIEMGTRDIAHAELKPQKKKRKTNTADTNRETIGEGETK